MKIIPILIIATLAGCASPDYAQYAKSAEASSVARSKALSDIAASGDSSAKVAAVMALALGHGSGAQNTIQAPQASQALQWAQVLVPGVTQVMGMRYQYLSQQTASNNAATVAVSTNNTMQGIAGLVQAPGAITTLSGTGTLGSGTYNPPSVVQPVVPTVPVVVTPDTVVITPVTPTGPVVPVVPVTGAVL